MSNTNNIQYLVLNALFTALIIVGSYLTIPLGSVPFVLSDFFVMLSGLVLGAKNGAISVACYLFLGAIGFPVFAGGAGGFQHLYGPTGGYLLGFLLAAFVIGSISASAKNKFWVDLLAVIVGLGIIYLLGVSWLKYYLAMDWSKAIAAGMLPFLIGAAIKLTVAASLAPVLRRLIHEKL